jgi:hypothetical protein
MRTLLDEVPVKSAAALAARITGRREERDVRSGPHALRTQMTSLTLARPDDWHVHLRDGALMASVVGATARSSRARS